MQPLRRGGPTYPRGIPVRWTALEIMLIILSLVMIAAPLSIGVMSLLVVPPAPAQELAQGPTRTATTPTGDTPTATATTSATIPTATLTATATTSATIPTATPTATATTSATIPTATPTATATTTATAGIQLFKLASLTEVAPGQPFRYTIWVATTSSTTQTVSFEDALDPNLELLDVSATTGSCSAAQIVRCNLETRSDAPAVVRIQVRVRTGVAPTTMITNSATANGVSSATLSVRVSEWVLPSPTSTPPTATLPPASTATPSATLPAASPTAPPTEPPSEEEEEPLPTATPTPTSTPEVQPSPTPFPPTPSTTATPAPPTRRPTMVVVRATPLPAAEPPSPTATLAPTAVATVRATAEAEAPFFRAASDWGSAYPEQQVGFTFVVQNSRPPESTGANDLVDLQFTGRLPNNLELLGTRANRGAEPQIGAQEVVHYLERLPPGERLELSITTKIRPQVAAGTLLITQGQLSYAGLAQALFSNIVALEVVSARPPAEALLMQIAAAYPEPSTPTASPPPPTATAPPATLTAIPATVIAPTPSTASLAAPPPPPAPSTPLPHTQGMLPLVGILLLGSTLFTRTLRLHRARERL